MSSPRKYSRDNNNSNSNNNNNNNNEQQNSIGFRKTIAQSNLSLLNNNNNVSSSSPLSSTTTNNRSSSPKRGGRGGGRRKSVASKNNPLERVQKNGSLIYQLSLSPRNSNYQRILEGDQQQQSSSPKISDATTLHILNEIRNHQQQKILQPQPNSPGIQKELQVYSVISGGLSEDEEAELDEWRQDTSYNDSSFSSLPSVLEPTKKSDIEDVEIYSLDLLVTKPQHALITTLYRFLKHCVPETHHSHKYKGDNSNSDTIKTFFCGYELIEFLLISKQNLITRHYAMDIAECIGKLHIFINADWYDQDKFETSHHVKVRHLNFKDNSTKYSFIPEDIIDDYRLYNDFLKVRFTQYRYFPCIENLINFIFQDNTNMSLTAPLPPSYFDCRHIHRFQFHTAQTDLSNSNSSLPSFIDDSVVSFPMSDEDGRETVVFRKRFDFGDPAMDQRPHLAGRKYRKFLKRKTERVVIIDKIAYELGPGNTVGIVPNKVEMNQDMLDGNYYERIAKHYQCVKVNVGDLSWSRFVPFVVFSVVLSTTGAAICWRSMHRLLGTPALIYKILAGFGAGLWIISFGIVVYSILKYHHTKLNDFKDLSKISFLPIASMSLFQLADLANNWSSGLSKTLNWISFAIQVFSFSALIYRVYKKWRNKQPIRFTPSYFFSGTGFLIASPTFYQQYTRLIYGFIYVDLILCVVLCGMMLKHLQRSRQTYFHLGYFGFSFPLLAFGTASLLYYQYTPYVSCKIVSIIIVSIANFIYVLIFIIAIVHAFKRNLFLPSNFQIPV
ncbi:hypothetical protein DFA_02990 [Cavenderia fasciculata]|uniref:DEP domain-containing protein n=1 Tax=Cavenderia fasciculata TaxID=261658 RepID=F4PGB2_CACFS|nr:uncharacterized protein DFA_02990 [Cavenderia fasciculata]EGG24746.1 hypothetical protein DFA_02990 [Cavenderia fasciculata]|eukprot:XP_004362597.1 hypothetical protein DFA_02990 [Cavenderia fasciculata]